MICGGAPQHERLALRLLRAAPRARIIYLSESEIPSNFHSIGIETLTLPLDANAFSEVARGLC